MAVDRICEQAYSSPRPHFFYYRVGCFKRTQIMINIGQSIKNELQKQERSISWLANKLGCNRIAVYRILRKNSIDTALLERISVILNHDFFKEYSIDIETKGVYKNDTDMYHL